MQTKEIPVPTTAEVDETALLDFMRRFAPKVEEELRKRNKYFGSRYVQELAEGEEEDVPTQKLVSLKKHKNTEKVKLLITAISHKVTDILMNHYAISGKC